MPTWDPGQYLKFGGERLRPAMDLLERIPLAAPETVFDLGCGAGNVTRILAGRWPAARVTGIDKSPEMLARAEGAGSPIRWLAGDLKRWTPEAPADLLFSNAALHWLDGHRELFPRLMGWLRRGGVLAVQMPRNDRAPSHTCMTDAAGGGPWRQRLEPLLRPEPVAPPEVYHHIVAPAAASVDLWETEYLHLLEGENPVVEWTRSTALRPLLDALEGGQREAFLADYSARVAAAYPKGPDGKTPMPYRRLFMVATR